MKYVECGGCFSLYDREKHQICPKCGYTVYGPVPLPILETLQSRTALGILNEDQVKLFTEVLRLAKLGSISREGYCHMCGSFAVVKGHRNACSVGITLHEAEQELARHTKP